MSGPSITLRWNEPGDVADAAAFAAEVIGAETDYISHGEIQTGLSDDGSSWVAGLKELYATDFTDRGERDLLVAREGDSVVGMLMVAYERSERRAFAVIEDMAVSPQKRSGGLGKRMLHEAQSRISERRLAWVFLESGLRNEKAHAFFEREGFRMVSHVYARKLD